MSNVQLELLFKSAPNHDRALPVPYEMLMKIFHYVVESSDSPIRDLCNIARVCEMWRMIVIQSPSLWSRIDFQDLPMTDKNFSILSELVSQTPKIYNQVREISLKGEIRMKSSKAIGFLEELIAAPNLQRLFIESLDAHSRTFTPGIFSRAISQCRRLQHLSVKNTRLLFNNQKWLADYLCLNGKQLEELHLTSSLTTVSTQLFRAITSDLCPLLRVLDISTCDSLNTRSFDAVQLALNMPNLVVLRVANVSFRRVHVAPEYRGLTKLEELSMPIAMRDADRDDALLATLAYGSDKISSLDLRGSTISAHALKDIPSCNLKELHIDDICPITRSQYNQFIQRWQHSLKTVSLVKINCSETIRTCLNALISDKGTTNVHEIDLESSDVSPDDLKKFLASARHSLQSINLASCRSLPRGCKGRYTRNGSENSQPMDSLRRRLGSTHSDSDTEIDEENVPRKRRRIKTKCPDYYIEF